jgi:integrase
MPRKGKRIRLWLRPERRDPRRKLFNRATWVILDGGKHIATGCLATEIAEAERKLAEYITAKYQPRRNERDIEEIDIADVLSIYFDDCGERQANRAKLNERLQRLNEFWGDRKLAEVNSETCRAYVKIRGKPAGARRDLEDLRAAINHHAKEGYHRGIVRVVLPEKGIPRDRWLTRQEAAKLLQVRWRARETQSLHRGPNKGERIETDKRPLRHLARFILIGLYTGTRASAIAAASPERGQGRSFVDLDHGIFYRLAEGHRATKKRNPPVPIPPRLLAHLRRWKARNIAREHFVEWNGAPVRSVKTAFKSAVRLAKLTGHVTPHTLRHTAATWLMQAGVDKWEVAGFLGMSVEILERVYGHHHPDYLRAAARAIGYRPLPQRRETLGVSLGVTNRARSSTPQAFEIAGGPGRTRTCNQTVMSGRL